MWDGRKGLVMTFAMGLLRTITAATLAAVILSASAGGHAWATTVTFKGGVLDKSSTSYVESGMEFISAPGVIGQNLHPSFTGGVGLGNLVNGQIEFFLTDQDHFKLDSILFYGNPDGGGVTLLEAFDGNTLKDVIRVGGGGGGITFGPKWSNIDDVIWCAACVSGFDTTNAMLTVTFNATPLPSTFLMLLGGLVGLGLVAYRGAKGGLVAAT
jgi:hypothetical protein